jgi:hypothetical protein
MTMAALDVKASFMNDAMISAVAALTGSALGGLTPIVSNYLIQRGLNGAWAHLVPGDSIQTALGRLGLRPH